MSRSVPVVLLALQACLFAQIGGYPGGGYPPGQYPGPVGGAGIPFPWPRKGKKGGADTKNAEALMRSTGKLHKIDDKSIVLALSDGRVLEYRRNAQTKFYSNSAEVKDSKFKAGDEVSIEAAQDDKGYLYARNVYLEKSAPAAAARTEPAKTAESSPKAGGDAPPPQATVDAPPPAPPDPDDPGPPTLRRGAPPRRETAETDDAPSPVPSPHAPVATVARNTPPPEAAPVPATFEKADPVLEKARGAAGSFSDRLPNYVCKEFMARFISTTHPVDWRALDIVSTDIVYENGRERYRDLAINGKPVHKQMDQLDGAWSTGEFASMLLDLFSPATAAELHFRGDSTAAGMPARVYNFTVQQPNSHWHVQVASQSINPAYKGAVWIDPRSGRVLRIEMQARSLPSEFPMDTVESAVDYDKVRIGVGEFLLPVHAETLSCQRGSANCSRNTIDFRNYHKYESESSITFDNSK